MKKKNNRRVPSNNSEKKKYIRQNLQKLFSSINGIEYYFIDLKGRDYLQWPDKLYKYCRFDENGFYLDGLKNKYLYLAPFDGMDDQFEATLKMPNIRDPKKLQEIYGPSLFKYFVKKVGKPNSPEVKRFVNMLEEANYSYEKVMEKTKEMSILTGKQKEYDELEQFFNGSELKGQSDEFAKFISEYRDKLGITSLCEVNDSQIMWQLYGDNYKGFIIEYSIEETDKQILSMLYPVIYQRKRDFDPLKLYIDIFANNIIQNEKIKEEAIEFIIFSLLTKNLEWELQKEWRLIGEKKAKIIAPKITGIYLGSSISEENYNKLVELKSVIGFEIYQQFNNYETTCLDYKKI